MKTPQATLQVVLILCGSPVNNYFLKKTDGHLTYLSPPYLFPSHTHSLARTSNVDEEPRRQQWWWWWRFFFFWGGGGKSCASRGSSSSSCRRGSRRSITIARGDGRLGNPGTMYGSAMFIGSSTLESGGAQQQAGMSFGGEHTPHGRHCGEHAQ